MHIILAEKHNRMKFKRVLAMTFTNKAANEMKERILTKLVQLSKPLSKRDEEDQEELKKFAADLGISEEEMKDRAQEQLNTILHNYGLFSVMTIDKFTHKVIRTFAKELGLSLDFNVELDLDTLRNNVADLLFEQIGRDEDITRLMVNYVDSNLEDDKSWNFKKSLVEFSNKLYKEDALVAIKELSGMDTAGFFAAKERIRKERFEFERTLRSLGNEGLDAISTTSLEAGDFKGGATGGAMKFFQDIASGKKTEPATPTLNKYINNDEWYLAKSNQKGQIDSISGSLKITFDKITSHFENHHKQYILNQELLKHVNNLSLMNHMLSITEELKQEENILLISDFYKKIADIISKEPVPFIYERLGVKYDHFLLDEFQDTSHLQWVNIVPLLHNSLAEEKTNLIVGDGKQAIYRWRNGEVDQFVNLPKIENPEDIASLNEAMFTFNSQADKIDLKENYRSAKEIIDLNNQLFKFLSLQQGDWIQNIYASGEQNVVKSHQGFVEFQMLNENDDQIHLKYALEVVNRSVAQGYNYSDICILIRKNQQGSEIAQYLSAHNIPVISQDSLYVSKDRSVKFIFNLIRSLASPRTQNYAKKTIEHYDLLFHKPNHLFDLLDTYISIHTFMKSEGYNLENHDKFHSFYEYVEHLIETFQLDLNENIYLQFFLEQVHLYEKRFSNNVHAFIEWYADKGYKQSVISPEGADAVNIMTIHKSKGLQFPIVLCSFFDWDKKKIKSEKWVINKNAPIPAYPLQSTENTKQTEHQAEMEIEDNKMELDALNMIYVSFTRAETALFVSGSLKKSKSLAKEWLLPFLSQSNLDHNQVENKEIYQKGEMVKAKEKVKEHLATYQAIFNSQVMNKPELSTSNSLLGEFPDLDKKRKYGIQLHLLLSKIKSENEIDKELDKLIRKGSVLQEFETSIRINSHQLFKDNHFSSYFEGEQIMNEKEIIDAAGLKHIPDKMIHKGNSILIVDFKTGDMNETKHQKQLQEYVDYVSLIEKKVVSGEIYYTETGKVLQL